MPSYRLGGGPVENPLSFLRPQGGPIRPLRQDSASLRIIRPGQAICPPVRAGIVSLGTKSFARGLDEASCGRIVMI